MVRLCLLLILLLQAGVAKAEPLDWLDGQWSGEGMAFGSPSEARLEAAPALAGQFVEIRYSFHPAANPERLFEGRAFYRAKEDGIWRARWFDSRGVTFPIDAVLVDKTLTAEWGDEGSERGRTVYRRLDDGRLEVVDHVRRPDGEYREFARHTFSPAVAGSSNVAAAFIDAYNRRDYAVLESLLAEDARWLSVEGTRVATEGEGASSIAGWTRGYLEETCTTCRSELLSTAVSGRFVTTLERASWTDPTGRCVAQTSPAVYEVESGRIKTVWYYPASSRGPCAE